ALNRNEVVVVVASVGPAAERVPESMGQEEVAPGKGQLDGGRVGLLGRRPRRQVCSARRYPPIVGALVVETADLLQLGVGREQACLDEIGAPDICAFLSEQSARIRDERLVGGAILAGSEEAVLQQGGREREL